MGGEGSRTVVERVAEVIDRIGDATEGEETAAPSTDAGTDRSAAVTPVTDGGADEASRGDSPWAADDPIVFDEAFEEDPGTAILEAVTDDEESAPPFGDVGEDSTEADGGAASDDRLDELEARIGALESDHAQLASQMTDVEDAVATLGADLECVGDDVRELVTLLGGVALASAPARGSDVDPTAVAAELSADVEEAAAAAAAEAIENADVGRPRTDAHPLAEMDAESGATPAAGPDSGDDAGAARGEQELDPDSIPEGIHRGVDETPERSTSARSSAEDDAVRAAPQSDDAARRDADGRNAGEHARELVDPRSDAVGARLRQFKERFVDDPTEDLPTGSSADEFRFEKVLLPTDGEAAPDLSTDELEKPYLEVLPDGYAADAVVLEWLDWLVSAADGETAARAIGYYESIDWLTDDARAELLGYLDGLGDPGAADGSTPVSEPPAALDLQDHLRSLQYVTELATGEVDADGI